jgi:hypothetical protein
LNETILIDQKDPSEPIQPPQPPQPPLLPELEATDTAASKPVKVPVGPSSRIPNEIKKNAENMNFYQLYKKEKVLDKVSLSWQFIIYCRFRDIAYG